MKKLKKSQIFLIATCAVAAVVFTLVLVAGLRADHFGFDAETRNAPRANVNAQTVDPQEVEISALEIRWLTGPVTVGASPDGMVHITERCAQKLGESDRMDVSVKSGKLAVRWDGQWFRRWFNLNLGWFGPRDKELEVLLPPGLAAGLTELKVENTSDDLTVAGCGAEKMEVSTVSGCLRLTDCTAESRLSAESVSGKVVLENAAGGGELHISTVSGEVEVAGGSGEELHIETVSGDCAYQGGAEEMHISTVSGDMSAALGACPEKAHMESVSGQLTLALPASAGFVVEHSTVSGDFDCQFPLDTTGGKSRAGSGQAEIGFSTTSGDILLKKN